MLKQSLISIAKVGENKGAPRVWFESNRLKSLGFEPHSHLNISQITNGIRLSSCATGKRKVSSKRGVPVIDLNSHAVLSEFGVGEDLRITSHFGRIDILPSRHTFHIREANAARDSFRVLECFAGGGTFHDALAGLDFYSVKGALELEARYLNVYSQKAPDVEVLLQGDLRSFDPCDFPRHDILIAGIPCTDHSMQGRAKKGINLKTSLPEDREVGNLYMDLLPVVRFHRPLAVVIENVPSYLTAEAGINLVRTLRQWGYSVTTQVVDPTQWGELTTRKRAVIVATLRGHFQIEAPKIRAQYALNDFLDPENPELDSLDAARDAHSMKFLAERSAKMAAKGNGWRHHVFSRDYVGNVPTITKGYYKRQPQSWAIQTPYGPRLLRKGEIARIHGHTFPEGLSMTLSAELSGQGVMSRVFRDIFQNLADFLRGEAQIPVIHSTDDGDQLQLFA